MGVFLSQRLQRNQTGNSQPSDGTGPRMTGEWLRSVLPAAQQVRAPGPVTVGPWKGGVRTKSSLEFLLSNYLNAYEDPRKETACLKFLSQLKNSIFDSMTNYHYYFGPIFWYN